MRHICSLRLTVTDPKGVQNPCLKISRVSLWVQLTTGDDTTQRGTSKQFGYNKHRLQIQDFYTHTTDRLYSITNILQEM